MIPPEGQAEKSWETVCNAAYDGVGASFWTRERVYITGYQDGYGDGYQEAVAAFVRRVDERAEADILAGNPITGAHNRALDAEAKKLCIRRDQPRERLVLPAPKPEGGLVWCDWCRNYFAQENFRQVTPGGTWIHATEHAHYTDGEPTKGGV